MLPAPARAQRLDHAHRMQHLGIPECRGGVIGRRYRSGLSLVEPRLGCVFITDRKDKCNHRRNKNENPKPEIDEKRSENVDRNPRKIEKRQESGPGKELPH